MNRQYYSQSGEDAIVWSLYPEDAPTGWVIEVGALDGVRFSNSYGFERCGWPSLCVEAHPDFFPLLKRNRPNSVCVHAAVSDHDDDAGMFFGNARGSLSTLKPELGPVFEKSFGAWFTGFEQYPVPIRTLNTILAENPPSGPIAMVSIDVEGSELDVLRGFDLPRYRPHVLIIEAFLPGEAQQLAQYLAPFGYQAARKLGNNLIFCRDAADVSVIQKANAAVPLIHVPHPLDVPNGMAATRG